MENLDLNIGFWGFEREKMSIPGNSWILPSKWAETIG